MEKGGGDGSCWTKISRASKEKNNKLSLLTTIISIRTMDARYFFRFSFVCCGMQQLRTANTTGSVVCYYIALYTQWIWSVVYFFSLSYVFVKRSGVKTFTLDWIRANWQKLNKKKKKKERNNRKERTYIRTRGNKNKRHAVFSKLKYILQTVL